MAKTGKRPSPPPPAGPALRAGAQRSNAGQARDNPRLKGDNRWQRSKRYGWDGR